MSVASPDIKEPTKVRFSVAPTGGRHIFFRCPEKPVQNRAGNLLGEGVDFRGDGGYVIFCGNLTADGLYKPIAGLDPWTYDLEDLPEAVHDIALIDGLHSRGYIQKFYGHKFRHSCYW